MENNITNYQEFLQTQNYVSEELKIDNDVFKDKRFKRYVGRISEVIYNIYCKPEYKEFVDMGYLLQGDTKHKIIDFTTFLIATFQSYYANNISEFTKKNHVITLLMRRQFSINEDAEKQKQWIQGYVFHPFGLSEIVKSHCFKVMIEEEISSTCESYLKHKSMYSNKVDKTNYFITIPNDKETCVALFADIILGIKTSLDNYFSSKTAQAIIEQTFSDERANYVERTTELSNKIVELEKTIQSLTDKNVELSMENRGLKKQLNNKHLITDEQYISIIEHNNSLQRQVDKLKRINASIKNKNTSEIIDEETTTVIEEEPLEIDCSLRYVFVGFEQPGYKDKIQQVFPNAIFEIGKINLSPNSVDMVILLTHHISHPQYYAVKEQCKNRGIPFVQSRHFNIELIKSLIWNYFYN
jgi:regulator of replication initiation timing